MNKPVALDETELRAAHRTGLLNGVAAYGLWGLLPLYFQADPRRRPGRDGGAPDPLVGAVHGAGPARRPAVSRISPPRCASRASWARLAVSAVLIAINWLVYIWAIDNEHVLAGSLGYFLNPLVNVLIGVVFLHERLRRIQIVAVAVAAVGVCHARAGELQTLWISINWP